VGDDPIDLGSLIRADDADGVLRSLRSSGGDDSAMAGGAIDLATAVLQSEPVTAERALTVAEQLVGESSRCEALPIIASAAYLRARLAVNGGEPDRALGLIEASRSAWAELGRPLDAMRTELGRMHVLDDLGRHHDAADAAGDLLLALDDIEPGLEPVDAAPAAWLRGAALENLGVAAGFTGRHEQALDAYQQAEELYRSIGDAEDVARCQANRGVELVAMGRALDGLSVLEAAAEAFLVAGNRLDHAKCLGHAVDAELLLGRYSRCLERSETARLALADLGARSERCRVELRTIQAYLGLNLVEEAEGLAVDTEAELAELGLRHDLTECRWLRGLARLRTGRADDALALLVAATEEAMELDDPPLVARILLARSEAADATGDRAEARSAAIRAAELLEGGDRPIDELAVRLHLAELDDGPNAAAHLQRSVDLSAELGLAHVRYPVLLARGRAARRAGRLDDAMSLLHEAAETVEGLRGLIADEAVRTSYLAGRTTAHTELIGILLQSGTDEAVLEAFELAERSKARTLADLLAGTVSAPPSAEPGQRSEDLVDLDAAYSALVAGSPLTAERRQAIHHRAVDLERRLLVARHRSSVQAGVGPAVERPEIRRPGPHDRVIEYHVVDQRLVAFVWSDGRLRSVDADIDVAEVDRRVAIWEQQVQRRLLVRNLAMDGAAALLDGATDALRQLWSLLLEPAVALMDEHGGDITIVPHGPLSAVPFHALGGPDGATIDDWTITVAPSFEVASRLEARPAEVRPRGAIIVGVSDEMTPAVEGEARRLAATLPGSRLLLGADATTDRLQAELASPADVIHLACHGLHRAANPMFSALRLADGWLSAADVLSFELDRSLVVLSACESGRQGGPGTRDEAIGLARSFLAAGAAAVVVSLWLADDQITAELMDEFYRGLAAGGRPAAALRSAQLALRERRPHPVDWAPFVAYGDH